MRRDLDHVVCHPARFDRAKLTQKNIHNTQYVAAMNPTAGEWGGVG